MAVVNGNDVGVYVEGQLIGCLTNATFTSTNNEIDVTCKDNSGARQVLPGGQQWSVGFEASSTLLLRMDFRTWYRLTKTRRKFGLR